MAFMAYNYMLLKSFQKYTFSYCQMYGYTLTSSTKTPWAMFCNLWGI